ncbi:[Pyruvate dehydrogenase (acetyl-transferring)] kinase isozyme 2 [Tilletia horrida]|uniref:Protein-serine/threonine kinase n=1 Tax=Tilletia horrida TaxID=155126 RepID=A0AAN6GSL3_9BASI|nr:[Pyruvate dehydrogenase (acetyl-transferring)] kinase isozyme 2 [Tilletia horrida]
MAQGSENGKARAVDDGPSGSSSNLNGQGAAQREGSSSGFSGSNTSTKGKEGSRIVPGAAGLRAGGIAAELAGLLRSSGKAGTSAAGSAGGTFGSGSALGDAFEGTAGSSSSASGQARTTAGDAFRKAAAGPGAASGSIDNLGYADEAASFFNTQQPDQARSSGPVPAPTGSSAVFQHPFLRPGAPLSPRLAAYSEALRGPWSTASDLDGQLHAQARRQSALIASAQSAPGSTEAAQRSSEWTQEFLGTHAGQGSVQKTSDDSALEQAWSTEYGASQHWPADFSEEQRLQLLDPAYHGTWAQNGIPTGDLGGRPLVFDESAYDQAASASDPIHSGISHHQAHAETDFFATLEAEEREEELRNRSGPQIPTQPLSRASDLASLGIDSNRLPRGITEEWRPPSPSQDANVSVEQLLLHRALAEKQEARDDGTGANADRAAERIKPAEDDERERQGIYAPTPEDALRSVWDGLAEAARVKRDKEARLVDIAKRERDGSTQELSVGNEGDVQRLIAEVKTWFPRGSYADEVHGVPPLLAQTLADAELPAEETDPELVERRLAAIRRLDAMRGHLFASGARSSRPVGPASSAGVGYDAIAAAFDQGDPARCQAGYSISQKVWGQLHHFASFPQTGISLRQMVQFGKNPTPGTLFQAGSFLAEELPVRLAHRVKELDELPNGLNEQPSIVKVKNWYAQSFEELVTFPKPKLPDTLQKQLSAVAAKNTAELPESTPNPSLYEMDSLLSHSSSSNPLNSKNGAKRRMPLAQRYYNDSDGIDWPVEVSEYNENFTKCLEQIKKRHDAVVTTVAQGVLEYKRSTRRETIQADVQRFLDRFYLSRIGIRFLIGQHIALSHSSKRGPSRGAIDHDLLRGSSSSSQSPDGEQYVGIICVNTNVGAMAHEAIENARFVCEEHYGLFKGPPVQLVCPKDLEFMYVPSHLNHMLFELLKNSLRAVVERYGVENEDNFPPIKVIVVEGKEDITIKISDEGGGIPRSEMPLVWTYMYTTAQSEDLDPEFSASDFKAPMAGFGYGLPLARLYARYFGGDLKLISMEGYGTDVYLHLNRLSSSSEPLP